MKDANTGKPTAFEKKKNIAARSELGAATLEGLEKFTHEIEGFGMDEGRRLAQGHGLKVRIASREASPGGLSSCTAPAAT